MVTPRSKERGSVEASPWSERRLMVPPLRARKSAAPLKLPLPPGENAGECDTPRSKERGSVEAPAKAEDAGTR